MIKGITGVGGITDKICKPMFQNNKIEVIADMVQIILKNQWIEIQYSLTYVEHK